MKDYESYDAIGLAELVRKGEVSARELVDACIERIEARNPALNAVVHKMYDRARAQADGTLPEGPFRGVPFLLKDLMAEDAGEPSTSSCTALAGWRADSDCELVQRFKRAGLVIVGRTNTPEFGIYGVTESAMRGPARNPWNTDHTTGGSSGGAGAAVASGMVPMAHGGDGGGSIRIPASHCGLFGLKPSRARVPMGPNLSEGWSGLVAEHVLTRSVRDSAAVLDVTHGSDVGAYYDARPPERPFRDEVGADPGKLRIAFTTRPLFADDVHADCVAAVEHAARLAEELGHTVEEAAPPFDRAAMVRAYLLMVSGGTATDLRAAGQRIGRRIKPSDVEPPTWLLKLIGDAIPAAEYEWHRQLIHKTTRDIARFFERFDVLLTSTTASPPVRVGAFALSSAERMQLGLLRAMPLRGLLEAALRELPKGPISATPNTMLFNMTGQPAMSTPLFWNAEGLPIGTQWVGRMGDEATLFRLAAQLEAAAPWADRRPPT